MAKKVTVISRTDSFMVKGLLSKLSQSDIPSQLITLSKDAIAESAEDTALYILCTDENIIEYKIAITALTEVCTAHGQMLILIGKSEERTIVHSAFPVDMQLANIDYPLNISLVMQHVERYMMPIMGEECRKQILVIDDDMTYLMTIRNWLKDRYRVTMVCSGTEAFTWLEENHADLILLDYAMPIMNGPMVLKQLKSNYKTSMIPVMFLTGKGDRESILRGLAQKPADYLLKEIGKAGLLHKLDSFFIKDRG